GEETLVRALERVWIDCVASIGAELKGWLQRLAAEPRWVPWRFELSFGLLDRSHRAEESVLQAAPIAGGLQLRGSIDLVERDAEGKLRATDHKSGKKRAKDGAVIGGGSVLQPVLYALALEELFPHS